MTWVRAFLELGGLRNSLAHLNFATFIVDETAKEVYEQFRLAIKFVGYVEDMFDLYSSQAKGDSAGKTDAGATSAPTPEAPQSVEP